MRLVMYDTQFIVKYKQIEQELILKCDTQPSLSLEYSKEDVFDICKELYQHELLSVFSASGIEDINISDCILSIWLLLKTNQEFIKIFEIYKQKYFPIYEDDMVFTSLFNYDFFYIIHKCVCQEIDTGNIDKDMLEQFKHALL